jgi:hypothetical protein
MGLDTEHDQLIALADRLDPDEALVLELIPRRGFARHQLKALRLLEVVQPVIPLRLPRGDHVVELAVANLLQARLRLTACCSEPGPPGRPLV